MNKNTNNELVTVNYLSCARAAVLAEKSALYADAASLWSRALPLTRNHDNRSWAASRIEFCTNAASRGWRLPDESKSI